MVSTKNRIGRTELSLALDLKHPALILELKDIPENRKTLWTGGHSTPWASYILDYQDYDKGRNKTKARCQRLREGSEQERTERSDGARRVVV
jgi:hypothetical protein